MTEKEYQFRLARCKNPTDSFTLRALVMAKDMGFKYAEVWIRGFVEKYERTHVFISEDALRKALKKKAKEQPFLIKKCN